jgi:predicted thioesterase
MRTGDTQTRWFGVSRQDTAVALGSGDLPVLGTPRLLAWCEQVTCAVLDGTLDAGRTSVGTRAALDHLGASPVGAVVSVTATVAYVDGRLVRFEVVAQQLPSDGPDPTPGSVVAHGEVTRVVVDRARFLSRLTPPTSDVQE